MNLELAYLEQSAVIPYQIRDGEIEILLITSRSKKRWIIPKGIIEPDLTPQESAAQEALEEGGILGEVFPELMGTYTYYKWGGTCRVKVYLLRVDQLQETWLESDRARQWFKLADAIEIIEQTEVKAILKRLPDLNLSSLNSSTGF